MTVPAEPRYFNAPSSTYKIPPSRGFTEGATAALAIAMTPRAEPNWLLVRKPILPPAANRCTTKIVSNPELVALRPLILELVGLDRNPVLSLSRIVLFLQMVVLRENWIDANSVDQQLGNHSPIRPATLW